MDARQVFCFVVARLITVTVDKSRKAEPVWTNLVCMKGAVNAVSILLSLSFRPQQTAKCGAQSGAVALDGGRGRIGESMRVDCWQLSAESVLHL